MNRGNRLIHRGYPPKSGLAQRRAKVHIRNILAKTGMSNSGDVVAMARACGLIRT